MNKTLVRLLARHLKMALRDDMPPEQDDLSNEPGLQLLGTLDQPHLKWLYGLIRQGHTRHQRTLELKKDPLDVLPRRKLRPHAALVNALMMLFERSVRLRFNVADAAEIVVTRDWKVYGYTAKSPPGCGNKQDCSGDCDDCDKDDCQDCGPNCKSRGGPGCGRDDCQCEEPPAQHNIKLTVLIEELPSMMTVGKVFLQLYAMCRRKSTDAGPLNLEIGITESGYQSMKSMCRLLQQICNDCEDSAGWCTEEDGE